MSVRSFDQFCDADPNQFFASLPGSNFNVTTYVNELCQLNITKLDVEAMSFMETNSSRALQVGPQVTPTIIYIQLDIKM